MLVLAANARLEVQFIRESAKCHVKYQIILNDIKWLTHSR